MPASYALRSSGSSIGSRDLGDRQRPELGEQDAAKQALVALVVMRGPVAPVVGEPLLGDGLEGRCAGLYVARYGDAAGRRWVNALGGGLARAGRLLARLFERNLGIGAEARRWILSACRRASAR